MAECDGEHYVNFTNSEEMKVNSFYSATSDFKSVIIGNVYYIYKNSFGDIVSLVLEENTSRELGYLIGAGVVQGLSGCGQIKLMTTENKIEIYNVEDKITWSDEYNKTSKKKFKEILPSIVSYQGPISYRLNEKGNISLIYLPVAIGVDREMGRLGHIYSGNPGYKDTTMSNFGTDLLCTPTVNAFAIYKAESVDDERYKYGNAHTLGFRDDSVIDAYNYEPVSMYSDFITLSKESSVDPVIELGETLVMIKDMSRRVKYKDEEYIKIEGYDVGRFTDTEFYILEDDIKNVKDTMNYKGDYTLTKGDIVVLTTKAADASLIDNVKILWRSDTENPIDAVNGRRGNIAGGLGYFDPSNPSRSNPFIAYSNKSALQDGQDKNICWMGYVYYVDNTGGLVVTNKDLSVASYEDGWDDNKHFKAAMAAGGGRYAIVNFKDDEIICREGTSADIRPYLVDGNDCSRFIATMNWAKNTRFIIINGEME